MKRIELKELQQIELDMLIKLDKFCRKNKINYFLGCGTLFGASVMNKFFPWDDDVDVLMPRSDYEKFIKLFKEKDLKILTCDNKDYYYPYAKLVNLKTSAYECKNNIKDYGVFVDVFPIDGVPNKIYLFLLKPIKYLMLSQWGCYLEERNILIKFIYKILSFVTYPFPKNFFAKKLNNICSKYHMNDYSKVGVVCHYKSSREIVGANFFKEQVDINFEGYYFLAPKKYKEYLKKIYGDYKEKKHHAGHKHFRAYWK